jgi:hypothetical protein
MRMAEVLSRLYTLNPRWLYLAVTVVLVIPLVANIPVPAAVTSPGARGVYDMIGACPSNKVVLIESSWDQGSKPECMALLTCVVEDLCRRKVRFVVFSTMMYSSSFASDVVQPITKAAGYVYGRDWVNLGFMQPPGAGWGVLFDAMLRDLHATRPADINGTPISQLPLMQSVRTAADIHMVYAVNYCPPLDWLSFGKAQHGVPIAFGSAAVMAPYYHVYLDSGQLSGLLTGNRGAYEYESLAGRPGMGSKVMMSFAFGHCFIIVAALLGNVGYLALTRARRRA